VRELLCVLKERVVKRRKSGGVKKKKDEDGEEEQEKRALDSPNGNREFFGFEDEKDGNEVEEK